MEVPRWLEVSLVDGQVRTQRQAEYVPRRVKVWVFRDGGWDLFGTVDAAKAGAFVKWWELQEVRCVVGDEKPSAAKGSE